MDKSCFYIAPVGPVGSELRQRSEAMFRKVIEPAATQNGLVLTRADYMTEADSITASVLKHVVESDLVIADLSGANPNVMYELGIRHGTKRPVIHVASIGERVPIDLGSFRTLMIDLQELDTAARARRDLTGMISDIFADGAIPTSTLISEAADVSAFEELTQRPGGSTSPVVSVLKDIEARLSSIERRNAIVSDLSESRIQYSRRIFLVHGHDGELKSELARFLQKLDFIPIILHERADRGQTIIAKLRGEMADVGFAFVLLTPDDIGGLASKGNELSPRARQNVVFEHGLFVGHLDPSRVCAIRRGNVETPSDLQGVLYKSVIAGGSISSIAIDIVTELRAAGYLVDANRLMED